MRVFNKKLSNNTKQTMAQKHGEIAYREKLFEQQILGKIKYFDDHKQNVEEVLGSWTRPQLSNLKRIVESIPLDLNAKILELGCEYGHCSGWLVNGGYSAVAVDLSLAALGKGTDIVCKRLGFLSLPPRVIGDIVHLPFRDGQFDVIFCFATLHHFPSLNEALIEVWRVLKMDGIFFFAGEPMGSILGLDSVYQRLRGIPPPSEVGYGILEGRPNYFQWIGPLRQKFKIVRVNSGKNIFSCLKVPSLALLYAVIAGTSSIEVVARKM